MMDSYLLWRTGPWPGRWCGSHADRGTTSFYCSVYVSPSWCGDMPVTSQCVHFLTPAWRIYQAANYSLSSCLMGNVPPIQSAVPFQCPRLNVTFNGLLITGLFQLIFDNGCLSSFVTHKALLHGYLQQSGFINQQGITRQ